MSGRAGSAGGAPRYGACWEGRDGAEWAARWGVPQVFVLQEVTSTNDVLLEAVRQGAPPGTVAVAESQTRGRGRRGHGWFSPPGTGIWMSIYLDVADEALPVVPLVAGVASARAVEGCTPVRVGLKWPNDLVVHGRKVGGILSERAAGGAVVGVGLNVREPPGGFPPALAGRAGSLEAISGARVDRSALAGAMVRELRSLTRDLGGRLPDAALEAWTRRDVLRDLPVRTETCGVGRARGIEGDGALLLEREDGTRVRVVAGSVEPLAETQE